MRRFGLARGEQPRSSRSTLLLVHTSAQPRRVADRLSGRVRPWRWLFLSDDFARFLRWREALAPVGQTVRPAPLIRTAATRLRAPFLDRITELGRRYDSLAWWSSRVSERNTTVSPLFLHCTYLSAALSALESDDADLCVVCQSWAVLESLAELAGSRGWNVSWITRPARIRRRILTTARAAAQLLRWLVAVAAPGRRTSAGDIRSDPDRPLALIRTWVSEASLGLDGVYRERYFPAVAEWLETHGWRTVTMPVLFSVERPARSAWRWFESHPRAFLNPESLYRWSDYGFALRTARLQASMPAGRVVVDGLEVTRLFDEEVKRWAFNGSCLDAILSYRLPRRLADAGLEVDLFVDAFENMLYEKALNLGFRRDLPRAKLVNIQPSAIAPLHLCLFVTPGEAEFAPLPDRAVCSGAFFRDLLIGEGLPADRVVAGPALRYQHLWEGTARARASAPVEDGCVLVLLSLLPRSAEELLLKTVEAFGAETDLRVLVKPHPMAPVRQLQRPAGADALPAHFEVVDAPMADVLPRARVAVAMETNSVYETLAAGVPVVVAGRSTGLDLNPLAWYPDLSSVFSEPEEILGETRRLLALGPEERAAYGARAGDILRESFNPVEDGTMRALVDGLESWDQARS